MTNLGEGQRLSKMTGIENLNLACRLVVVNGKTGQVRPPATNMSDLPDGFNGSSQHWREVPSLAQTDVATAFGKTRFPYPPGRFAV